MTEAAHAQAVPSELSVDRALLERVSVADKVADVLRHRIAEGYFPLGSQLSEEEVCGALGVSRTTVREAFRVLTRERLLVHHLNRGVFVRVPTPSDVVDAFRVLRLIEGATLRFLPAPPYELEAVESAVADGERRADEGAWRDCAAADMRFHQALVALAGSSRLDELMRGIWVELRLALHMAQDLAKLYEGHPTHSRKILTALADGDTAAAVSLLDISLENVQAELIEACRHHHLGS